MHRQIERGLMVTSFLLAGGCSGAGLRPAGSRADGTPGNPAPALSGDRRAALDPTDWLRPPVVAPILAVPAGATIKLHAHGAGAQVYTCTARGGADGGGAAYAWVLKAPDATLYDASGATLGTHGAGPSWTASDGSVVSGTKVAELASAQPDAIPSLLLRASSTSGQGMFSDVTHVQRLGTTGGKAPPTGCDSTTVGMHRRVGYSAEYFFYTRRVTTRRVTALNSSPG